MFGKFRREKTSIYDEPITAVLERMKTADPEETEFKTLMKHLDKLTKMKAQSQRRVSPDTMFIVVGNLIGILVIVGYEQKHVLRSTATAFLQRIK